MLMIMFILGDHLQQAVVRTVDRCYIPVVVMKVVVVVVVIAFSKRNHGLLWLRDSSMSASPILMSELDVSALPPLSGLRTRCGHNVLHRNMRLSLSSDPTDDAEGDDDDNGDCNEHQESQKLCFA